MPPPVWAESFQRLVLALAVAGDWPARIRGALSGELFGGLASAALQPPRQRVGVLLAQYWATRAAAPGFVIAGELVRREAARVTAAERVALEQEWAAVMATVIPEDCAFVEEQIRDWARYQRYSRALVQGATMLEQPDRDYALIRAALDAALGDAEGTAEDVETLLGGAAARVVSWGAADDGLHVPTGLRGLDEVLGGGPRVGESFYFLAPPKGAKTSFQLAVALGASRHRHGVLFVSYEMRARRVLYRADRALTRATRRQLQENPTVLERTVQGYRAMGAGEVYVLESVPQQQGACEEAARWVDTLRKRGGQVSVVVLDYLNIMGSSRTEREKRHELARISREIHALAVREGVVTWSAALVNRQAVDKKVIRKTDIAEAFEVIAVLDGAVAICADAEMRAARLRRLWGTAFREAEDERSCGTYEVDLERMMITSVADLVEGEEAAG